MFIVKRVEGKNGKSYYYETFKPLDGEKPHWYRIGADEYKFTTSHYLKYASDVKRDNSGVIWMEYSVSDEEKISDTYKKMPEQNHKDTGCAVLLIFLGIVFLVIYLT